MKKVVIAFILLVGIVNALHAQKTPAEQLATRIAQKMKDTLNLTDQQKEQLFTINMNLSNQKAATRQQYAGSDLLGYYMQRVENARDSLYRSVINNEEKYQLYKLKKRNLVSNN